MNINFFRSSSIPSIASFSQFPTQLTALHLAAWFKSSVPVVTALLEGGADPNARDGDKQTPLHFAAHEYGSPQIVSVLLESGADPNVRNDLGKTPLDYATDPNIKEIIRRYL